MQHNKLELDLIVALSNEWLAHSTPNEIGSDVAKIRLLKRFAREVDLKSSELPKELEQFYAEVFLRGFDEVR